MINQKKTIQDILLAKSTGHPLSMITAYDFPTALLVDEAGFDIVLVGDSLSNVVLGYDNTLPVTMDQMIHHCAAVRRGLKHPLLIGDMPFMSYEASIKEAVHNAGRFIKEAGAEAVKLEGGCNRVQVIKAIIDSGIPVQGHIGLTPQRIHQFGGYRVQGRTVEAARKLISEARLLEEAGVFSIILECVPWQVAKIITEEVSVPTIGIGAGPHCDGQVLVFHDLLGFTSGFKPKFVKQYIDLHSIILEALSRFKDEVETREYPNSEFSYSLEEVEHQKLLSFLQEREKEHAYGDLE
ncbi:MAG: 3-methyl-2-oxobutanoate hydroxymethyltransferase [Promethearchaeota archaeon]